MSTADKTEARPLYFMLSLRPSEGPHEHEPSQGGCCGRVFALYRQTAGKRPTWAWWLEDRFRGVTRQGARWSWGNAAIIAPSAAAAADLARHVLGDQFIEEEES